MLALPAADPANRMLLDGVANALLGLERTANGLVLILSPGHEQPDRGLQRLYVPDILPAVLNALRTIVALTIVEFFWVETDWSTGQQMVTFAAVGVTLFAVRGAQAYDLAVGYAVGAALAACLAAIVNFAVLPAQQGFLALSLVLACVQVPFGAFLSGSWQTPLFTGLVTLFLPLLAPENQPVYDPAHFYNTASAIVAGTITAAVVLRLIPPLSPAWRTQRLLDLTLWDVHRLAVRSRYPAQATWTSRICHRLAALPTEASREDGARLVAALSVGNAIIDLRDARGSLVGRDALDHALAHLAKADIGGTQAALELFSARQSEGAAPESTAEGALGGMRAQAAAAVISQALGRHPLYFAAAAVPASDATFGVATGHPPA